MRAKINQLEEKARLLEPDETQRRAWDEAIQSYAHQFINNIEKTKAYVVSEDEGVAINSVEFDGPKSMKSILDQFERDVDGVGLNPASGGHLGYIPGGGIYPTALGDYLAAVTNRYAGIYFGSPGAVRVENRLIKWMNDMIGYPEGSLGNLTSGGSIANLIAFTTARDHKEIKASKVEKSVIYLTAQVHHCVQKAIRIVGLDEAMIRYIPMDDRYRMDVDVLAKQVQLDRRSGLIPFMVVGSIGTTDVGAVDPINAIAEVAEAHDMWFHIDAAYGGFFILADVDNPEKDTIKDRFIGVERSDSLAIDPHKGMFLAYGLGAILIKNTKALFDSFHYMGNYMQDALEGAELSPADLSPELTKHFRGLRMWLPLQLFGVEPFKAALEEKILLCRYFYNEVQKLGFEVGPFPELSVCIYRFVPKNADANAFNELLVKLVQEDGRVFVSSTSIDGVYWIRLAVLSFRTHLREMDILLEILAKGVNV